MDPAPPEIPGYDLIRTIGSGAYGDVWLARDRMLGIHRAVKIIWLASDQDESEEVRWERRQRAERVRRGLVEYLRRADQCRFPAVAVLEVKQHPSRRYFYYSMPLADDVDRANDPRKPMFDVQRYTPCTLSCLCSNGRRLDAEEVLKLGVRLATALGELHAAGVVHQDIKPSNIIFIEGQPTFADIDLVRATSSTRTVAGTPGYSAPEGAGTRAADIYSLGKTLFVAASGASPYTSSLMPGDDWDRRPDAALLAELNLIWLRACEPLPELRYSSASVLRDELAGILAGKRVASVRKRNRFIRKIRFISLILFAVVASVTGWLRHNRRVATAQMNQAEWAAQESLLGAFDQAAEYLATDRLGKARARLGDGFRIGNGKTLEFRILWKLSEGDPSRLTHVLGQQVEKVAFSPNGSRLAIQTSAYEFRVMEAATLRTLQLVGGVDSLCGWCNNEVVAGTRLVGQKARPAILWDAVDGRVLGEFGQGHAVCVGALVDPPGFAFLVDGDPGRLGVVRLNPEPVLRWLPLVGELASARAWTGSLDQRGRVFAAYSKNSPADGEGGTLCFARLDTSDSPMVLNLPRTEIRALALSADGTQFAYSESKQGAIVRRFGVGMRESMERRLGVAVALSFSKDARWLAAASDDSIVRVYDTATLTTVRTFVGHTGLVTAMDWAPDGMAVATGDTTGQIRIWSLDDRDSREGASGGPRFHLVGLKPSETDGQIVADRESNRLIAPDARGDLELVDSGTMRVVRRFEGYTAAIHAARNTAWLRSTNGELVRLNLDSGARAAIVLPGFGPDWKGVASPNGNWALIYDRERLAIVDLHKPDGSTDPKWLRLESAPTSVSISEDARIAAIAGSRHVLIIGTKGLMTLNRFRVEEQIRSIALLPAGDELLVTTESGKLLLRSTDGYGEVTEVRTDLPSVEGVMVSAGHRRIVVGGGRGELAILDLNSRRRLALIPHPANRYLPGTHRLRQLTSPGLDGEIVALTDAGLLLRWPVAPETEIQPSISARPGNR